MSDTSEYHSYSQSIYEVAMTKLQPDIFYSGRTSEVREEQELFLSEKETSPDQSITHWI